MLLKQREIIICCRFCCETCYLRAELILVHEHQTDPDDWCDDIAKNDIVNGTKNCQNPKNLFVGSP